MAGVAYATVEQLQAATDFKSTAYETERLRRLTGAASRLIEKRLHRHFYPLTETRTYTDPPIYVLRRVTSSGFWLEADLLTLTSVTADSTAQTVADVELYPSAYGPPYSWIGVTGSDIDVVGVWGFSNDTTTAGATAEALDATETGVDVTDSSVVGLGDLIIVDSERMLVTAKAMLDTGVDFSSGGTTAVSSDNAITMDGAGINVGEVILADAERMLVVEYVAATDVATVKRAYDGTVLATHTTPSVYAPRTLTVERGAAGSTAATHLTAAAVTRNLPPGPVTDLCIAETLTTFEQEMSGYGRTVGSGETAREARGAGLADVRRQAQTYKRTRQAVVA